MAKFKSAESPWCNTSTTSKASKGQWWKFELRNSSAMGKASKASKAKWLNLELLAVSILTSYIGSLPAPNILAKHIYSDQQSLFVLDAMNCTKCCVYQMFANLVNILHSTSPVSSHIVCSVAKYCNNTLQPTHVPFTHKIYSSFIIEDSCLQSRSLE